MDNEADRQVSREGHLPLQATQGHHRLEEGIAPPVLGGFFHKLIVFDQISYSVNGYKLHRTSLLRFFYIGAIAKVTPLSDGFIKNPSMFTLNSDKDKRKFVFVFDFA